MHIDINLHDTEPEDLEQVINDGLDRSCETTVSGVRCQPAIYVSFGHSGYKNEEHYKAHIFWNCLDRRWCMGLSYHGLSNQMQPYYQSLGAARYSNLRMIFCHLKTWKQIPRRVNKWIERHNKEPNHV